MAKFIKNNFGLISVVVISLLPIFIWVFMQPLSSRFFSTELVFKSLGQIAGLLGTALISLNFIMSARFKFLDRMFNGLNRVYIRHHLDGAIAFCLILFHPIFLAVQYSLNSIGSAFDFLFSFNDLAINLGEIAIAVFIVLMAFTFYFSFKYQNWKNTHKFLGIVLVFGTAHMLLVPSDISRNNLLKYYMLILAACGFASYLYRTVFSLYKNKEHKYQLSGISKINDDVIELNLKPLEGGIKFLPGQFIFIRFEGEGQISESHPFSISSRNTNTGDLSVAVKVLGDYTSILESTKIGAACFLEGPFGVFSYKKVQSKKQIWMAGGIGITPFLGMARQIDFEKDGEYKIDLFYSVKDQKETAFAEELKNIADRNKNLKFHLHFSDKFGYITADAVLKKAGNSKETEIFLCGPGGFMQSLRSQFVNLGFDNKKIYSEEFSL